MKPIRIISRLTIAALALLVALGANRVGATDYYWTNTATSGYYTNSGNWSTADLPTNVTDTVLFTNASTYTVLFNDANPLSVGSVYFTNNNSSTSMTVTQDIGAGQSWIVSNLYYVGRFYGNTKTNVSVISSGTLVVTNGNGTGTIIVGNGDGSGRANLVLNGGTIFVNQLLVTNNTASATNAFLTLNSGTLITSNAATAVAANIVVASNTTFSLSANWNMLGGSNLFSSAVSGGTLGNVYIGKDVSNRTVTVNSGASWNLGGLTLTVGGGTGNVLVVNGGVVTNLGTSSIVALTLGVTQNSLIISNGGRLILAGGLVISGSGNTFQVGGLGAASYAEVGPASGSVRLSLGGSNNNIIVTNAILSSGKDNITSRSNTISVLTGGVWLLTGLSVDAAGVSNNVILINGGIVTNTGTGWGYGVGIGQIGNRLVISNGGQYVQTGGSFILGGSSNLFQVGGGGARSTASIAALPINGNFNTMNVTNADLRSGTVAIGTGGSGNTATVWDGGIWNLQGSNLTIGAGVASNNVLQVYGGLVTNVSRLTVTNNNTLTLSDAGQIFAKTTTVYGVLSGSGTINGLVDVKAGGELAPGNSIGTLTVGNLTLTNGTKLNFELGGPGTNDQVVVLETLNLGNLGGAWTDFTWGTNAGFATAGEVTYTLIDAAFLTGSLGSGTNGTIYGWDAYLWKDDANANLMLTVIPEPSALTLVGLGLFGSVVLRRLFRRRGSSVD